MTRLRAIATRGQEGNMPLANFGRSVNPIVHNHFKLGVFSKDTLSTEWWILAMGLTDLLRIADLYC